MAMFVDSWKIFKRVENLTGGTIVNVMNIFFQNWVVRLSKKIQKSGYKANNTGGPDGAKVSPR